MDGSSSSVAVLPMPRLRLSRHTNIYQTAGAGPSSSRLPDAPAVNISNGDDDDDEQPTPKVATTTLLDSAETPAARLRALLSRTPVTSKSPTMPHPPPPPSENDSDFDPPNELPPATPSLARESLKDIFSRALRDSGDTPQKKRRGRRRNSFDVSEVDVSPRTQQERSRNKGNRKSLSDEEIENLKSSQRSENSFKSSQATTFDILRERLMNSQIKDQHLSNTLDQRSIMDNVNSTFLRDVDPSSITPPAATSTPQQSLRMSANSQFLFQSNLMEPDSEMQRAIEDFASYEADKPSQHPASPSKSSNMNARGQSFHSKMPRRSHAVSSLSHRKSLSFEKLHDPSQGKRGTEELRSSSRASSSHSSISNHPDDRLREQGREWNRPRTPIRSRTPEPNSQSRFPGGGSPARGPLSRQGSASSLRSGSSKGGSISSQSDYRERLAESEKERNIERERGWNKPHPTSRPTSSLSLHSPTSERIRTQSVTHLTGSDSTSTHIHRHLHHRNSFSSFPRMDFSASSSDTSNRGKDEPEEIIHERERNWNAPRPKWTQHGHSHSSASPSRVSVNGRTRAESLRTSATRKGELPIHREQSVAQPAPSDTDNPRNQNDAPLHLSSSLPPNKSSLVPLIYEQPHLHPRPREEFQLQTSTHISGLRSSPSSHEDTKDQVNDDIHVRSPSAQKVPPTSSSGLHTRYSFIRNRTVLPPIQLEKEPPERPTLKNPRLSPSPTIGVKTISTSIKPANIPIESPRNNEVTTQAGADTTTHPINPNQNNSLSQTVPINGQDKTESDKNDDGDLTQERTPTIRTIPPASEMSEPVSMSSPPRQSTLISDQNRLEKALGLNNIASPVINTEPSTAFSPPPSPVSSLTRQAEALPYSPLSTPPRHPPSTILRPKRHTPSPPRNLPELPEPPSSDEHQELPRTPDPNRGFDPTALKTPRPPGAWASTPALSHDEATQPKHIMRQENESPPTLRQDPHPSQILAKTPRPPGAWTSTPAPLSHHDSFQVHLCSRNTSDESGLVTPVASFSKASLTHAQTPGPPGTWVTTPAARKSILKVRFDAQITNSTTESPNSPAHALDEDSASVATKVAIVAPKEDTNSRGRTPEPPTPVSPPPRSSRSPPRKSPAIRVVDAFGREVLKDASSKKYLKGNDTLKSKGGVVDAMGHDVHSSDESSMEMDGTDEDIAPLNRHEALVHVRRGLSDLAHSLDEIDRTCNNTQIDYTRLRELNNTSRIARQAREELSQTLSSNEAELQNRIGPLRGTIKQTRFVIPIERYLSWTILGALLLQLFLVFLMYRVSTMRAKDLFLTTYYDPFYPDLHLYTSRPDTLRHSMLSSYGTPWFSLPDTLRREGWKTSVRQAWDNLLIVVWDWQQLIWETFGNDTVHQNTAWPPT